MACVGQPRKKASNLIWWVYLAFLGGVGLGAHKEFVAGSASAGLVAYKEFVGRSELPSFAKDRVNLPFPMRTNSIGSLRTTYGIPSWHWISGALSELVAKMKIFSTRRFFV